MGRLGDSLDALRAEDGSVDEGQREAGLAAFVQQLTASEIRSLRLRLNAVVLPNDLCTRFPLEIIQTIAKYLNLEEIIRARHVSKSWWNAFGGRDTSIEALKWHFPLIWERDFRHRTKTEQLSDNMKPDQLLLIEARKLIRRKSGQYHSMAVYHVSLDMTQQQYCNGRFAFKKPGDQGITVWSLRSDVSSFYVDENREPICHWTLSDSLLVCEKRNPSVLLVWRLDAHPADPPITIHVPNQLGLFMAYHDQVAISTKSSDVMIWTWGGALRLIDTSVIIRDMLATSKQHVDIHVFFHPYDPDHVFLVFQMNEEIMVSEHKFTSNQWTLVSTHRLTELDAFGTLFYSARTISLHDGNIGIHGYDSRDRDDAKGKPGRRCRCSYLLVTFNIFTKTFEPQKYSILQWASLGNEIGTDGTDSGDCDTLFWRDQLLTSIYETPLSADFKPEGVTNMILAAFNNSGTRDMAQDKFVRWYGQTMEDNRALDAPCDSAMKESALAYCWIGGNSFAEGARAEAIRNENESTDGWRYLQGDDDFVVQHGSNGFVVWCFDETVTLRRSGSSLDPNLPPDLPHPFFSDEGI